MPTLPVSGGSETPPPHPALRGHLLPFWRYAPPPPYRGSLSLGERQGITL